MPRLNNPSSSGGNLDVAVSSRAAIVDYTAARGAFLDRLQLIAAGGAGELTAARAAALDQLIATGVLRAGTAGVQVRRAGTGNATVLTAGAGTYVMGAYAQIVAAADLAAHDLVGYTLDPTNTYGFQIDIATGTIGNEVVLHSFFARVSSAAGLFAPTFLCVPQQIGANVRVAARCAASTTGGLIGLELFFLPRPF